MSEPARSPSAPAPEPTTDSQSLPPSYRRKSQTPGNPRAHSQVPATPTLTQPSGSQPGSSRAEQGEGPSERPPKRSGQEKAPPTSPESNVAPGQAAENQGKNGKNSNAKGGKKRKTQSQRKKEPTPVLTAPIPHDFAKDRVLAAGHLFHDYIIQSSIAHRSRFVSRSHLSPTRIINHSQVPDSGKMP